MADFSLTTVFVVPTWQSDHTVTDGGSSTQDLIAGEVGIFGEDYVACDTPGNHPYFYIAQGRTNTYLQGSKRSDKIKGCTGGYVSCRPNVTEWYKVCGCPTPINQITEIDAWNVKCGDIVTLTIRAHSSYIDTLYFNGLTRSVTLVAPCCDCDGDPCDPVNAQALVDEMIDLLETTPLDFLGGDTTGTNPDNIYLSRFFTFTRSGSGATSILVIEGKPLTAYGQPCDVAAFPFEYDRMWFRTFVYSGPATTADFIVADACNIVAESNIVQTSSYATGTSAEIAQLEKNYYSYQAGYLKHLYRIAGYNGNFESWVTAGTNYDTYYIKFNDLDKSADTWGDYIKLDSMVIIAVEHDSTFQGSLETALGDALGAVACDNDCRTTTTTTTVAATTTTTTTGN